MPAVNQPVTFTDISTNNPTVFDWDFGDGTVLNGTVLNPVLHTYINTGTYIVSHTAYNSCGAGIPVSKTVLITCPEPVIYFTVQ